MTDTPGLVEVALPRPLRRTFTYSVPAGTDIGALAGCRVAVRFGRETLIGYVWGAAEEPPRQDLKQVLGVLDRSPLLPPAVMAMVRWASDYYLAPPGMLAAAAHPPGMSGRARRFVRALPGADAGRLPALLARGGPVASERLDRLSRAGDRSVVAELEREGLAETFWLPAAPAPSTESWLEAALPPAEISKRGAAMKRKAPRRAALLLLVADAPNGIPLRDAMRLSGASRPAVDALVSEGLLREGLREAAVSFLHDSPGTGGPPPPDPTPEQAAAIELIAAGIGGAGGTSLLFGVTGSGKTEVYMRVIERALAAGRTALVLVPEISLTPQLVSRFSSRFPGEVAVLHSGLASGERRASWQSLRDGRRRIAIGARSAVFAPLSGTGVIVVDEEHDSSYKQDGTPGYHARDLAVVRGRLERAAVVLGSASPSLESWSNAAQGKYRLVELPARIDGRALPPCRLLKAGPGDADRLPPELVDALNSRLASGEKSILLMNRRGFAPSQVCRSCGRRETCSGCGVPMTYHRRGRTLKCHHCGEWMPAPERCPGCGSRSFAHDGPGVQKVEEMLGMAVPGARVLRMDSDTTSGSRSHWEILGAFSRGEADILLGTQMVAKGHDFPDVTLVGILQADLGMSMPDFRAGERIFQLVLQAAGRSGRGADPGLVLVQAWAGDDPVLTSACRHDYTAFVETELPVRRSLGYPPFGRLARFLWSGGDQARVDRAASSSIPGPGGSEGIRLSGPSPAAIPRIGGRWRTSALARSESPRILGSYARKVLERFEGLGASGVRLDVDIDPVDMM